MQKVAILTDSASDLTKELMEQYNIKFAPFRIIYSDREYEDKIDITPNEMYASLKREIPTTSLPNIGRIEKILCSLEEEGYTHVISINISSALSGTSNSVRLVLEDHPKLISYVYDTKTLCMAEGVIVIEAAKLVLDGKSFEEIIKSLPGLREKSHCYFTLNTLEYLKRGGRIGKVAGTIGELLNLKPIIHVGDDGIYHTYAKLRGRKQSINKLFEVLTDYLAKGKCNIWIIEGDALETGTELCDSIKGLNNVNEVNIATVGPALGVHTGPGLIGLIIQEV
ncbi:DegV family protein [Clostridium vincentii]|uniref:DegV domain-containing protein n=1 Tax=Clostridium vincentii TaxID=52704 RepID=A0A2T0BHE6_9CLOT|nr:DegV family protein [Clostridium vincentii]PRR83304.1 DegV domain-containing protein [Clostridium vincentii]